MKHEYFPLKKPCFWRSWEDKQLDTDWQETVCQKSPPVVSATLTVWHTNPHVLTENTSIQLNAATRSTNTCNIFIEFLKWEQTSLQDLGCSSNPYAWTPLCSEIWRICTRYCLTPHTLKHSWQHCLRTYSNTKFKEFTWAIHSYIIFCNFSYVFYNNKSNKWYKN